MEEEAMIEERLSRVEYLWQAQERSICKSESEYQEAILCWFNRPRLNQDV
ncbi:MAG: hypothetical protein L3J18_04395 [Candidatus Brocadia sp.]|nr:MAG: hypothetical protein L3J18_04395 [Candidatus Brocadia sp.]